MLIDIEEIKSLSLEDIYGLGLVSRHLATEEEKKAVYEGLSTEARELIDLKLRRHYIEDRNRKLGL